MNGNKLENLSDIDRYSLMMSFVYTLDRLNILSIKPLTSVEVWHFVSRRFFKREDVVYANDSSFD
jgi:hypothetical protein